MWKKGCNYTSYCWSVKISYQLLEMIREVLITFSCLFLSTDWGRRSTIPSPATASSPPHRPTRLAPSRLWVWPAAAQRSQRQISGCNHCGADAASPLSHSPGHVQEPPPHMDYISSSKAAQRGHLPGPGSLSYLVPHLGVFLWKPTI